MPTVADSRYLVSVSLQHFQSPGLQHTVLEAAAALDASAQTAEQLAEPGASGELVESRTQGEKVEVDSAPERTARQLVAVADDAG